MDLAREIAALVAQIPEGRVATFLDVAAALGDAKAAPTVFRILGDGPAEDGHRVVRATGEPAFQGALARLRREGLAISRGRVADLDRGGVTGFPGSLASRESPAIKRCLSRLDPPPDVLMIDGHGVLHPARLGIASFAGVRLDRPTIGVAKSLLVGEAGPGPRQPAGGGGGGGDGGGRRGGGR